MEKNSMLSEKICSIDLVNKVDQKSMSSFGNVLLLSLKSLFIWKASWQKMRQRIEMEESFSTCFFTSPLPATTRAMSDWSQEPGTPSRSVCGGAGHPSTWTVFYCIQGTFAGCWLRGPGPGTGTRTLIWMQVSQRLPHLNHKIYLKKFFSLALRRK